MVQTTFPVAGWVRTSIGILALLLAALRLAMGGPSDADLRQELERAQPQQPTDPSSDPSGAQSAEVSTLTEQMEQATQEAASLKMRMVDLKTLTNEELLRAKECADQLNALKNQKSQLDQLAKDRAATSQAVETSRAQLAAVSATPASYRTEKAVVIVKTDRGHGTGLIVDAQGLVVTNYHVIALSEKLSVHLQQSDSTQTVELSGVSIAAVCNDRDLALLRLPPAPASVSANGQYPVLDLRNNPVEAGEAVRAMGNPGLGREVLDYTVTSGIVSNPKRQVEKADFIQTSAPVNGGNSGGPLLDAQGKVVGVITLKGRGEGIGFAIPASDVAKFLREWSAEPNVVKGTLQDWEKAHRPLAALLRRRSSYKPEQAIEVPNEVNQLILAPSGNELYLRMALTGKVAEFDLAQKKIVRTFNADSYLGEGMQVDSRNQAIYLTVPEKKSILRVNLSTLTVKDETPLAHVPVGLMVVPCSPELVVVLRSGNSPLLLSSHKMGKKDDGPPLEDEGWTFNCASNTSWFCLVRRSPEGTNPYELIAYRTANVRLLESLCQTRADAMAQNFPANLVARLTSLRTQIEAIRTVYTISEHLATASDLNSPLWLLTGDRAILGRRLFRLGNTIKLEGLFDPSPYSLDERPEMAQHREMFALMDSIYAVSPNGQWAASGTHVYSVSTRKPVRVLPFPTQVSVFSKDGKTLYLYDPLRVHLYILTDWELNTEAL